MGWRGRTKLPGVQIAVHAPSTLKSPNSLPDTHHREVSSRHPRRDSRTVGIIMRKTTVGVGILAVAAGLSYGCHQATHPSHTPDDLGNAAPLKQVADQAHVRDIGLEPYDAVDHLYRNAKSQIPTS